MKGFMFSCVRNFPCMTVSFDSIDVAIFEKQTENKPILITFRFTQNLKNRWRFKELRGFKSLWCDMKTGKYEEQNEMNWKYRTFVDIRMQII